MHKNKEPLNPFQDNAPAKRDSNWLTAWKLHHKRLQSIKLTITEAWLLSDTSPTLVWQRWSHRRIDSPTVFRDPNRQATRFRRSVVLMSDEEEYEIGALLSIHVNSHVNLCRVYHGGPCLGRKQGQALGMYETPVYLDVLLKKQQEFRVRVTFFSAHSISRVSLNDCSSGKATSLRMIREYSWLTPSVCCFTFFFSSWEPVENLAGSEETLRHFIQHMDTGGRDHRSLTLFSPGEYFFPVGPPMSQYVLRVWLRLMPYQTWRTQCQRKKAHTRARLAILANS